MCVTLSCKPHWHITLKSKADSPITVNFKYVSRTKVCAKLRYICPACLIVLLEGRKDVRWWCTVIQAYDLVAVAWESSALCNNAILHQWCSRAEELVLVRHKKLHEVFGVTKIKKTSGFFFYKMIIFKNVLAVIQGQKFNFPGHI